MKLSIIIPQYNETEAMIKPLLSSIDNQVGVNFNDVEVIIINDGNPSTILTDSFLATFANLNIQYLKQEINEGCSVARNVGLEKATGDYVMFCDADDRFKNCDALVTIFAEIAKDEQAKQPQDFYIYDFIEEVVQDGKIAYINHKRDFIFLHGKVYSRKFLSYNNITFSKELRRHTDSYFNGLCRSNATAMKPVGIPLFLWCYNPKSMARANPNARYDDFPLLIKTATTLVDKLISTNNAYAPYYVTQFAFHMFWQLQNPEWNNFSEVKADCEKQFYAFFVKYENYYKAVKGQDQMRLYSQERSKVLGLIDGIDNETFPQFIQRLKKADAAEKKAAANNE